mgnify:CR=1 FL=1
MTAIPAGAPGLGDDKVDEHPRPTFQRERAVGLWDEIIPLLQAHKEEIAHYPDISLDPDVALYNEVERQGVLRCYTVRLDGELVGYAVFFIRAGLHYRGSLQAVQDVLFLWPNCRCSSIGYRLIQFAEAELKAEGVQVVFHHIKAKGCLVSFVFRGLARLLSLLGYELVDLIFAKRLDREG